MSEWVSLAFDKEEATSTASVSDLPELQADLPFSFVEIMASVDGEVLLAGVAALKRPPGPLTRVPKEILNAVGEELVRSGDAAGRPIDSF